MENNQTKGKEEFSSIDGFYWIEKSFFQHLQSKRIITDKEMEDFILRYKKKFAEMKLKVKHLIQNELDKGNVYFTLIAGASYDAFLEMKIPKEDAILLVDECLNKPSSQHIIDGTRQMLDNSSNPFQSLVKASKEKEKNYFGDSFEMEHPIDNEFGYVLHIKKCLFHLTLKELDKQVLQPVLCRFDLGWINGIDPKKHNLQFVRPVTFATGNTCQMWFIKKEKEIIVNK